MVVPDRRAIAVSCSRNRLRWHGELISFLARKTRLVCRLAIVALVCSSLSSGALAQVKTPPEQTPTTSATRPIPSPGIGGISVGEPLPVSGSASLLPRDLSPWGMFLSADVVVKVVMAGLALASLVTWTVAFAKSLEIFASRRRLRAALRELTDAQSLAQAASLPDVTRSLREPVEAALAEIRLSPEIADKDSIKERIVSRLERVEAATGRALVRGTGALATIGATAPFIGLFGTVWGIMNSFIGISQQHTTNLAVVAPGIAEALLATALGLAAAIPAVVIYNMFSRSIANYRALYADGTAAILRAASRDLDCTSPRIPVRGSTNLAAHRP
jgi:biopolymer transport protein ExbB